MATTAKNAKPLADVPWTMKLADGRTLVVAVPGKWATRDRIGELSFKPDGVRLIDCVQVLCDESARRPSPGYVSTLREALGLSQQAFADELDVAKMTVARREWGQLSPRGGAVKAMRLLRRRAVKRGVTLAG